MNNKEYNNPHGHHQMASSNSGGIAKFAGLTMLVLVVIALSFMGGMQYQKGKKTTVSGGQSTPTPPSGQDFGNFQGGGPSGGTMNIVLGEVTAISSTSISVKDTRGGSTTTLSITSGTQVTDNNEAASINSIKVGDNVVVRPNSSNSKQADQIILNPQMPSGGPGSSSTTN